MGGRGHSLLAWKEATHLKVVFTIPHLKGSIRQCCVRDEGSYLSLRASDARRRNAISPSMY